MAVKMRQHLMGPVAGELRYEPTETRVRALTDGDVVADTMSALLVWEPRRVVPAGLFNPLITTAFRLVPGAFDVLVGPLLQRMAIANDDVGILERGVDVTATTKASKVQCLVPVTTVALISVPKAAV